MTLPQPGRFKGLIIRGFTHPPRSNKSHNNPVHQQVGFFASDSGPPRLDRLRTLTDIWCALAKQAATYPRRTHNCPGKAKDTGGGWPADAEFSGHPATQASFRAPPFIHFLRFRSLEASRQAPPSGCRLKHRESLSQPVPISYLPKGIAALTTSKASSDGNVARKLRNQQNSLALTCVAPKCS